MSCKLLCVIISDRGVLRPGTSRENNCVVTASVQKSWAELSGEMLGWEITSPFPAAILLCWEASESRVPELPAAPRRMYVSCLYFTRKSQSRSSHSARPPNIPSVPVAPVKGAQLLKPPDIEKRLPRPRGTEGHGVWNVAGGEERRFGVYDVIMLSNLYLKGFNFTEDGETLVRKRSALLWHDIVKGHQLKSLRRW